MKRPWLGIALLLLIPACSDDAIDASGEIVSEVREVTAFERVDAGQGVHVRIVVDPIAAPAVTVHYDDNLIDDVTTMVSGDTLEVRLDTQVSFRQGADRFVEVVVADLSALKVSSGAGASAVGATATLDLDASGGARADLTSLVIGQVEVDLSGGASVDLQATEAVEGDASGGATLTIRGNPPLVDVATSGGASITNA